MPDCLLSCHRAKERGGDLPGGQPEFVAAGLADCAGDDGCWLRGGECVVVLILLCNASGEAVTYLGNIEWSDSTRSQFVLLRGAACSCVHGDTVQRRAAGLRQLAWWGKKWS